MSITKLTRLHRQSKQLYYNWIDINLSKLINQTLSLTKFKPTPIKIV